MFAPLQEDWATIGAREKAYIVAVEGKAAALCVPYNRRQELASHIRSALAPVCDFRMPMEKVRDRIADRADFAGAA